MTKWLATIRMIAVLLVCALAGGCASSKKTGMAYTDEYDAIKVEQTMGNSVSAKVFQKTIICLNPRRETRRQDSVIYPVVSVTTNIALTHVTNQTITATTNLSQTLSTNLIAMPAPVSTTTTNETGGETNVFTSVISAPPPNSTNNTVTASANMTVSRAPSQTTLTANHQQLLNRQVALNTTNMNLLSAENQVISIETNIVVNTYTNISIATVTNYPVVYTNMVLREYYLFTEFTPPPDFTLQSSGESLVLLVDGVRHGFAATNSQTSFVARKGFQSSLYRVPPQLLTDMANAKEVKLRLKGVNSVLERKMNAGSRANFRRFMLKYFTPDMPSEEQMPAERQANLKSNYETN